MSNDELAIESALGWLNKTLYEMVKYEISKGRNHIDIIDFQWNKINDGLPNCPSLLHLVEAANKINGINAIMKQTKKYSFIRIIWQNLSDN